MINGNINDFMSIREASERWGLKYRTLQCRFNSNSLYAYQVDRAKEQGWAKQYKFNGNKTGTWIIHRKLMESWYGFETKTIGGNENE